MQKRVQSLGLRLLVCALVLGSFQGCESPVDPQPQPQLPPLSLNIDQEGTSVFVEISSDHPKAEIYYTLDGSDPKIDPSQVYDGHPLEFTTTGVEIKARAFLSGWKSSSILSQVIELRVPMVEILGPPPGHYTEAQSFSLHLLEGVDIRYTLDGSLPREDHGFLYDGEPIAAPEKQVTNFVFVAFKPGLLDSHPLYGSYSITGQVPEVFLFPEGEIFYNQSPLFTFEGEEGDIYYTTDGTLPTRENGTLYTGPFSLEEGALVQARAYKDGWRESQLFSRNLELALSDLAFTPPPDAPFEHLQWIGLEGPQEALIRYTLDGSEPTSSHGQQYTGNLFIIQYNTTVKARAFRPGFTPSNLLTGEYRILSQKPTISLPEGTYGGAQGISLSTESGASIYYTLDGSEPTNLSTLYSGPFTLSQSSRVKARSYHPQKDPSPILSAHFTIFPHRDDYFEVYRNGGWKNVLWPSSDTNSYRLV